MQNLLIKLLLRIISPEKIGKLIAGAIAKLLNHAKDKGGDTWDRSKDVIKQVQKWSKLFLQVYEDDTLTDEEEHLIAQEIANMTSASTIEKLLREVFNGKE